MRKILTGLMAFIVALLIAGSCLLRWPTTDWLPRLLPDEAQLDGMSGNLGGGSVSRVTINGFSSGPWMWSWQSPRHIDVQLGATDQEAWQFKLSGWPWEWSVSTAGGDLRWWQRFPLVVGTARGDLEWRGSWQTCSQAAGELNASSLLLLVPYPIGLGKGGLTASCADTPILNASIQGSGTHALTARFNLLDGRGHVEGEVDPGSALGRVLFLGGLAQENERRVRFGF
ncbi:hypothetical protein [Pseudomonas sp. Marseille-QA0892]